MHYVELDFNLKTYHPLFTAILDKGEWKELARICNVLIAKSVPPQLIHKGEYVGSVMLVHLIDPTSFFIKVAVSGETLEGKEIMEAVGKRGINIIPIVFRRGDIIGIRAFKIEVLG